MPHSHRLRLIHPKGTPAGAQEISDPISDARLLEALRDADPSAARAIYDRIRPAVDRTLSRLLGTADPEYEDAAQLTFVELIKAVEGFRGDCPLEAWVSVLAARVVYRLIRRRRKERRIFSGLPFDELAALSPRSPGTNGVVRHALERVRRHLEGMDERRAWAYLLHDVYGYELKEIGEILGISASAAQSRLVRGRGELQQRVEGDLDLRRLLDEIARIRGAE